MSRNISPIEKALIIILILGAIGGLGAYFLVLPAYREITAIDDRIAQKKREIGTAEALKQESFEIDELYEARRLRAGSINNNFHPEMSASDAVRTVQDILQGAGISFAGGLTVSEITGADLKLEMGSPSQISYGLREYAFLFENSEEGETGEEVLSDAMLLAVIDTVLIAVLLEREFGEAPGEEDETYEAYIQRMNELSSTPGPTLKREVTDMLKQNNSGIQQDIRSDLLELLRESLKDESVNVGVITASFTMLATYRQYTGFLDYINNYPQYTSVESAKLWQNAAAAGDELRPYEITLNMYVLLEMQIPESTPNPFRAGYVPEEEEDNEYEEEAGE